MTNPVQNAAIEDVLSSIRKLVSEDSRAPAPQPAPEARPEARSAARSGEGQAMSTKGDDTARTQEGGRLLLTEAFRVHEPKAPALSGPPPRSTPPRPAPLPSATSAEDAPDEALRRLVMQEVSRILSEGGLEPAGTAPQPAQLAAARAAAEERARAVTELDRKIEALEKLLQSQSQTPAAPAVSDAPKPVATVLQGGKPNGRFRVQVVSGGARDAATDDSPATDAQGDTGTDTSTGSDIASALEAEDVAAKLVTAEPRLPDEAALRALISEVLRQELRGVLGERITRNVRKMVRREIQQALMSPDGDY